MKIHSLQHLLSVTEECFGDIEGLCGDLSDDEWQVQSLCPDWNVRQCLGHAVGVEDALRGWEISSETMPAFERMTGLTEESVTMTAGEFGERTAAIFGERRAELAALSDDDLMRESFTPVGVQAFGRFWAIRIFDMWVHVRDCTIPLGRTTDDHTGAAAITLEEVEGSIGYIVGKKIGLPDGMSLRVDVTGPLARQIGVVVEGRASAVDPGSLEAPDVVLTADSTTLIMLACGRIDPQEKIDSGEISWSGNDEWGEKAARNLAFTM